MSTFTQNVNIMQQKSQNMKLKQAEKMQDHLAKYLLTSLESIKVDFHHLAKWGL